MTTIESTLQVPPSAADAPARVDESGVELKRGAILNTIAMLASNFRGIFTFLVARLLGPAVLGMFSVAWSATDLSAKSAFSVSTTRSLHLSRARKLWVIVRAAGCYFDLLLGLAVAQSVIIAVIVIGALRLFGARFVYNRKWFLPWPFSCARCRAWRCIASAHLCRVA